MRKETYKLIIIVLLSVLCMVFYAIIRWKNDVLRTSIQEKRQQLTEINELIGRSEKVARLVAVESKDLLLQQVHNLFKENNVQNTIQQMKPVTGNIKDSLREVKIMMALRHIDIENLLALLYSIRQLKGVYLLSLSVRKEGDSGIEVSLVLGAYVKEEYL